MRRLAYLLAALLCASGSSPQTPATPASRGGHGRRAAGPAQRIRLAPQLVPGTILRYQMEFRTTTEGHRAGLIEDPQAPSQLEISWGAVVRLEVLGTAPEPRPPAPDAQGRPAAPSSMRANGRTRLRATYEKAAATVRSDTFDPEATAIEERYRRLEGGAVQLTLDAEGKVTEMDGLQEVFSDERAASAAREWFSQLAMGASLPREGIARGQKWSSEQPAASMPLAGVVWRSESTYLRDERCRPATEGGPGTNTRAADASRGETCAVILTRSEMAQPRPLRDPTPEDYRKRDLRTAGTWAASAESLSYISLRTGWVVSTTQSGTEVMDVIISTADGESSVRYAGRVRTEASVTLISDAPAAPR